MTSTGSTQSAINGLLADVYTHPEDDEPRRVLADALEEEGSPRGTFINLQLAATRDRQTRRMRGMESALLHAHRPLLHGALAPYLSLKLTKFARGFPAQVTSQGSVAPPSHELSAWNTVEELFLNAEATPLLERAELRSLRVLTARWEPLLRRHTPLPSLVMLDAPWEPPIDLAGALAWFPHLALFSTWGGQTVESIWQTFQRVPKAIARCELPAPVGCFVGLIERWASDCDRTLVLDPMYEARPEGHSLAPSRLELTGARLVLVEGSSRMTTHRLSIRRLRQVHAALGRVGLGFAVRGDAAWISTVEAALGGKVEISRQQPPAGEADSRRR